MACHAFWNAAVQVWGLANLLPGAPPLVLQVAAAILAVGGFALAVWFLARRQKEVSPLAAALPVPAAA
jgi:hypothetical protein